MTTTYIITFYTIFIPVVILAVFAAFKIGYNFGKTRQMFPHIKFKNVQNNSKNNEITL